jgi:hypothetical protein
MVFEIEAVVDTLPTLLITAALRDYTLSYREAHPHRRGARDSLSSGRRAAPL